VLARIQRPGWQIWPGHNDPQIVDLQTFFLVSENWKTHQESVTVGTQTVTVTATPKRSHWTWAPENGSPIDITCEGPGTAWVLDLTVTDCGYQPKHSSAVIGEVDFSVHVEYEITSTAGLVEANFTDESASRTLCVSEVLAYLTVSTNSGAATGCDGRTPHTGDNPDGSVPAGDPLEGVPLKTLTCTGTVTGGLGALGLKADGTGQITFIVEELADGGKRVTLAADVGLSAGLGSKAFGAGVQVNDFGVGAYFSAGADAHALVGAGVEYELEAGETVEDLLVDLLKSEVVEGASTVGKVVGVVTLNPLTYVASDWLGDKAAPAPEHSATFLDYTAGLSAGASGIVGVGFISVVAEAGASAEINTVYKDFADGRSSHITTYTGELSAGVEFGVGIPFINRETAAAEGKVIGSTQVETIYDEDGNPLELIVTVSHGSDGDAHTLGGEDEDTLSITTQQWTFDLQDEATLAAVGDLDQYFAEPDLEVVVAPTGVEAHVNDVHLPGQVPGSLSDDLLAHARTTGPVVQQLTETSLVIQADGGVYIAGVDAGIDVTCLELS